VRAVTRVNAVQGPEISQCGSRPVPSSGKADTSGEASEKCIRSFRRGIGDGTYARGAVRNKGSLPGCSRPAWRAQRSAREGEGRPRQMTDGLVVPLKPGNAGGGKGP